MKVNRNPTIEDCINELNEMLHDQKQDLPGLIELGLIDRFTANQKYIAISKTIEYLKDYQNIKISNNAKVE
jgi:hypothetical protein